MVVLETKGFSLETSPGPSLTDSAGGVTREEVNYPGVRWRTPTTTLHESCDPERTVSTEKRSDCPSDGRRVTSRSHVEEGGRRVPDRTPWSTVRISGIVRLDTRSTQTGKSISCHRNTNVVEESILTTRIMRPPRMDYKYLVYFFVHWTDFFFISLCTTKETDVTKKGRKRTDCFTIRRFDSRLYGGSEGLQQSMR